MNCPKCGEKMRLHQLRVRLELPAKEGEKSVEIDQGDVLFTVDVLNPTRPLPLAAYMCPNLRCDEYVITPDV